MKATRRSFFGLAAVVAAAGPAAVKHAADELAKSSGSRLGGYGGAVHTIGYDAPEVPGPAYWEEELKNAKESLLKVAERRAAPYWQQDWDLVEARRISGLRSVSPAHQARMMLDFAARCSEAQQRSWFSERIENAKKQLGLLGKIFS